VSKIRKKERSGGRMRYEEDALDVKASASGLRWEEDVT